jgi:hypothetical protein
MAGKKKVVPEVVEEIKKVEMPQELEKEVPNKGLVEFEHFSENGLMYILHDVYKVENHRVWVKAEHIPQALAHGLKLVEK